MFVELHVCCHCCNMRSKACRNRHQEIYAFKKTFRSLRNKKVKNMHIPKSDCIADAYSLLLLPSRHCCHCQNFVVNCHGFYGDQDSQMPQTPTYDVAAAQPSDLRIVAHLVGVLAAYSVHADFIHLLQVPVQLSLGI
ncbi:PREDICTED: uncharacterized protein LOC109156851 isoform X2 [Ipomoea nil]|uniref:uncharacterized protein LOC109156851 isoform X2 n=1 Tax=Ipomoea nil TaxID=35883 RepID=UPI000901C9AF|nr:PREDICTED: uncharacterized protein LOC109156851 isoform X2 [Ipomoea nil]